MMRTLVHGDDVVDGVDADVNVDFKVVTPTWLSSIGRSRVFLT